MTRGKRIALELLGPGLLGSAFGGIAGALLNLGKDGVTMAALNHTLTSLVVWPLLLPYAYVFAAIPSLIYAAILEWSFGRGLAPHGLRAVVLSTVLGLASGVSMAAGYGFQREDAVFLWIFFPGTGFAVGLTLGWMIRHFSRPRAAG